MRPAVVCAALLALPCYAEEIASFWHGTLARLAAEPVNAVVTDTREPLPYKKYGVEYQSLGGVRVRAWLSLPIRSRETRRALPAVVTVPGYGGWQQGVMLDECQRGYAILQVYPRSQGPSAEHGRSTDQRSSRGAWNGPRARTIRARLRT